MKPSFPAPYRSLLLLVVVFLAGCASFQERLRDAEREGRTADAFWISVEFYDSGRTPEARAAMERYANAWFDRLLQSAETHLANNRYSPVFHILDDAHGEAVQPLLTAADARGITIARRDRLGGVRAAAAQQLDAYYAETMTLYNRADYPAALFRFGQMQGLKDADRYAALCRNEIAYAAALAEFSAGNYRRAYAAFGKLPPDFRDAAAKRREAFERGKIVVALYNFTGDDRQILSNTIARSLADEPFVEILRMNGRYGGATGDINRNGSNEILVVIGAVSTRVVGPVFNRAGEAPEAWAVTGETQEITTKDGAKRYVRVGRPVGYSVSEISTRAEATADYDVLDGRTLRSVHANSRTAARQDVCRQFTAPFRYSPELFSLTNPAADTLNFPITAWKPTAADRRFQRNFTENRNPETVEALLAGALDDVRYDIARDIRGIIGRKLAGM